MNSPSEQDEYPARPDPWPQAVKRTQENSPIRYVR